MIHRLLCTFLLLLSPLKLQARAVFSADMPKMIAGSSMVFAGRVESITRSGITTKLSYPTWKGHTFEWLEAKVTVLEPIKGATRGATVRVLMLSVDGIGPIINPPGMVRPERGRAYLFCLLPTERKGTYASLTAPFDDREAIMPLNRKDNTYQFYRENPAHYRKPYMADELEKIRVIWSLVDNSGRIRPRGAEHVRQFFAAEIAKPAPSDAVIHLKWKKATSRGWEWNVPEAANPPSKRRPASKR
jgi:hypothetical protein